MQAAQMAPGTAGPGSQAMTSWHKAGLSASGPAPCNAIPRCVEVHADGSTRSTRIRPRTGRVSGQVCTVGEDTGHSICSAIHRAVNDFTCMGLSRLNKRLHQAPAAKETICFLFERMLKVRALGLTCPTKRFSHLGLLRSLGSRGHFAVRKGGGTILIQETLNLPDRLVDGKCLTCTWTKSTVHL